ncbi:hypothetical protein [Rathayibacter iranicus]|uniref:DUF4878 domain-containing protein n=1 Tax=Rathayibacter iranicus NCPPB 2253 = VKM Ac-1602 TaxID=1328868 RepID=A0ABX5LF85_9MICO|nr:hypothetical protein [Rathayibacter iranicus]MWV31812.1 hypothetical protein [Rathayibacter iranicus NCPPB 2253 = VKM Ac-1602]PWJ62931.1 hypothetical protein B0H03_10960 [Rathayibacter iranicus NCPPB 2253 = VKM Ac-1602]
MSSEWFFSPEAEFHRPGTRGGRILRRIVGLSVLLLLLVAITVVAAMINDDPTAGTVPPAGADRSTVADILRALDASDPDALGRVVPATSAELREQLALSCGDIAPDGRYVDIHDDLVPMRVGAEIGGSSRRDGSSEVCTLDLRWLPDQGWKVSARSGAFADR